ncbi:von Willebrand factor A domain-containing protein 7-like [Labrus mixtus]|uniref:von Willebrand factor A domain-containing protein 7-like n=1 Tax=Labrus mixtus TaxID=508554 RepID=UPI0029BFBB1B|nr:von Willebrand factor A domain-containing protein 7-like [Labrus mixtus]
MSLWLGLLSLLILDTRTQGFGILPGDSLNHLEITERAILNVTVQVCHDLAAAEGADFTFPLKPFSAEGVAVVCGAPKSSKSFRKAIRFIILRNIRVDLRHALNASFHFDEEMFGQGRNIISEGVEAIKASNVQENYEAARQKLGEICHPLQDFYSHSNWVELGNKFPNSNLLQSGVSIGNIADESRATCRSCDGDDCRNNILEDIIENNILTSGYFGVVPLTSTKPKGKCSHGGAVDQTSIIDPIGGINKDTFGSSHGHLHTEAANMAIAATSALLEDIRKAAGDRAFLQMLGLSKGSSKALCFVIDTTKSMSDDIEAVRNVISFIINSEERTENEPAAYILVPFSDPEFGPLIKTTDPKVINTVIDSLSITGGGDEEELSLSGLQLALSGAPSNSEIFLFTDAPAKDKHLKNTVIALIERTQTVINVMISGSTLTNRRRRRDDSQQKQSRISAEDTQLYRELSQASGGQTAEVTNSELPVAISIISDTLNSSVVTLLQSARNPGNDDDFPFIVDETIINLTVYITGRSVTFTLISPTGESQQSTDTTGSLITSSRSAGNLQTLQLQNKTGLWEIKMVSIHPYTLKVIGQSPIDFLFDFVEESQGTFEGFDVLDSRPRAGVNGSLLVSLTGSTTATVTEVALVESWGSEEIKGVVDPQGSGNFLVHFDRIPSFEFVVRLMGRDDSFNNGASIFFQRQTPTNFRSSSLTITADSTSILVPTQVFSLPFSVTTHSRGGNFTVRATNSRRFSSTFPTSLSLKTGDTVNGTVTLSAPRNTPSGTDVTLTIEVEAPRGEDMNYVMLRFTVINPITDFTQPQCELLTLQSNCSDNCSLSTWTLFVRVDDGAQGTGVNHVRLRIGNGTIITNPAADNENVTMVFYSSSCCSPDMELLVADNIGNVGTCYYSSRESSPAAFSMSTRVTQSTLLCLSIVVGALILTERGFY